MTHSPLESLQSRRDLLGSSAKVVSGAMLAQLFSGFASRAGSLLPLETSHIQNSSFPLQNPNKHGMRLPKGFTSRIIAISGEHVPGTSYTWHKYPDGGACFPTEDGGWIYACNSERQGWWMGGASAIRFDRHANIEKAYPILSMTTYNCAGGATPWGTWLSAEEVKSGSVWECDVEGHMDAQRCSALGTFRHEACAVDPKTLQIYMTEDESVGRLYRFTPTQFKMDGRPYLDRGLLQAAEINPSTGYIHWHPISEPNPHYVATLGGTPLRYQVPETTPFNGGEGISYYNGSIIFVTKGDHKVHRIDLEKNTYSLLYEPNRKNGQKSYPFDAVTISPMGHVLLGGNHGPVRISLMTQKQPRPEPLFELINQEDSEIAGLSFDPSMTRLYFSSQKAKLDGSKGNGVTYEITGPFTEL